MMNPLVASVENSTKSYTGTGLVDNVMSAAEAIEKGDWTEGIAQTAVAALSTLGAIADPLAFAISAGVGWVIEHCDFFTEALNALAGDPDLISSFAATWNNVSGALTKSGQEFADMVAADTAGWSSIAVDAYRNVAASHVETLTATGVAAAGVGAAVTMGGVVVGTVRSTVRDLVAEAIGNIVSKALQAVTVVMIPKVVPEIIALVAKWSIRIADWLRRLVRVISKLTELCKRLKPVFEKADEMNKILQDQYDVMLSKVPALKSARLDKFDSHLSILMPRRPDDLATKQPFQQYPRVATANNVVTESGNALQGAQNDAEQ